MNFQPLFCDILFGFALHVDVCVCVFVCVLPWYRSLLVEGHQVASLVLPTRIHISNLPLQIPGKKTHTFLFFVLPNCSTWVLHNLHQMDCSVHAWSGIVLAGAGFAGLMIFRHWGFSHWGHRRG